MTRTKAKELLPAIQHFANGGELVSCRTDEQWFRQSEVYTDIRFLHCANVIKDKHFEARKAYALGEEIEVWLHQHKCWCMSTQPTFWRKDIEYRPKPKKTIYEWQYYYKLDDGRYRLTSYKTDKEAISCSLCRNKFKPSKRLRK